MAIRLVSHLLSHVPSETVHRRYGLFTHGITVSKSVAQDIATDHTKKNKNGNAIETWQNSVGEKRKREKTRGVK